MVDVGHSAAADAVRTRTEILDVATREFADRGYNGARVDEIATKIRTTKRMIYYYFGSKEQLYIAVLERVYQQIRTAESGLDVDGLDPVDAIRRIAELTFDHHQSHPDFIRLVSIENINRAEHMAKSPTFPGQNASVCPSSSRSRPGAASRAGLPERSTRSTCTC